MSHLKVEMKSKITLPLPIVLILVILPSTASAGVVTCNGLPVTIVGVVGTPGDDVIVGTSGNDIIDGGEGNDTMCGGTGHDGYRFNTAFSPQTDTVVELAGEGLETFYFNNLEASDPLTVDLSGGLPWDTIAIHTNRTINVGAPGQEANFEMVQGGIGNDIIFDNPAVDNKLDGGRGSDTYVFLPATTPQTDTVRELRGNGDEDWLDFEFLTAGDPVTVNLGSKNITFATHTNRTINQTEPDIEPWGSGIDGVWGTPGNDNITGNPAANILVGGEGDDLLAGSYGNDVYLFLPAGSPQTDTVAELGDQGPNDLLNFDVSVDDPVTVNLTSDTPIASHTNRTINTAAPGQAANFEDVWNGPGNDLITGNAANNVLWDWEGADIMAGGLGDDVYYFFPAASPQTDTIVELSNAGNDWLFFSALVDGGSMAQLSTEGLDLERLRARTMMPQFSVEGIEGKQIGTLQAADAVQVNLGKDIPIATHANRTVKTAGSGQALNFENAVGGAGDDLIIGNKRPNILAGGWGNDTLKGLGGKDILIGEEGNDILTGGGGKDILVGDEGEDILDGGAGKDIGDGGSGTDVCKTEIKINCP